LTTLEALSSPKHLLLASVGVQYNKRVFVRAVLGRCAIAASHPKPLTSLPSLCVSFPFKGKISFVHEEHMQLHI